VYKEVNNPGRGFCKKRTNATDGFRAYKNALFREPGLEKAFALGKGVIDLWMILHCCYSAD
jgi:hypothetical protein